MASVSSLMKIVRVPIRLSGTTSDVEGAPLYYEVGTFSVADNVTSSTLATDLTAVKFAYFQPLNSYAVTAAPLSTNAITTDGITITTTDPGGTANFAYLLVGTVETN
jgi:hypothetical protein